MTGAYPAASPTSNADESARAYIHESVLSWFFQLGCKYAVQVEMKGTHESGQLTTSMNIMPAANVQVLVLALQTKASGP